LHLGIEKDQGDREIAKRVSPPEILDWRGLGSLGRTGRYLRGHTKVPAAEDEGEVRVVSSIEDSQIIAMNSTDSLLGGYKWEPRV